MSSVFRLTLGALLVIAALAGSPAWARFPTYLELTLRPNPAAIGEAVTIECRLWAKGAANTTQRVQDGILRISIFDLDRRSLISQLVERPTGGYDVFEFPWRPPGPGRYKIEASYTGSGFLAAVMASKNLTVTRQRARPKQPTTTSTSTTTTTTTTTTTSSTTTTAFLTTTTTLPKAPPPPPTTLAAAPEEPETVVGEPPSEATRPGGLEEEDISDPAPSPTTRPPVVSEERSDAPKKGEPLRNPAGELITRLTLSSSPGQVKGEYLVRVEVTLNDGRPVEEGEILVTVNGGRLDSGAGGQALLSAAAGAQFLVWKAPSRPVQKRYKLEAAYFGGQGPEGTYGQSSANLELPPLK